MEDKEKAPAEAAAAPEGQQQPPAQTAPVDALEKTNEELSAEAVNDTGSMDDGSTDATGTGGKKISPFKAFMRKFNVYLLGFLLIVAVVAATAIVSFLNSKKAPETPAIATQQLTQDALKQLANSNTSVGNATQTLTVQGNAIIAGQLLVQKDLDVAGRIRLGGDLQAATLTVAGKTNLADTQINSLQVANNSVLAGTTTTKDLNVSGTTSLGGPVTAPQLTVTRLILSGNAVLQIPNHIAFTGAPPSRTIDTAVLGAGGTASINGSDTTGTININTGNSPVAGCFVKITFAQVYTNAPHILISPVGAGAGQTQYYVTKTTAGFSLCTFNAAPANQVFGFDYFVTN